MTSFEARFRLPDPAAAARIRLLLSANTLGHLHSTNTVTRTFYVPDAENPAVAGRFLLWSDVPPNGKEYVVLEPRSHPAKPGHALNRMEAVASRDMMRIIQALGYRPIKFQIQKEHFQTGATETGFLRFTIEDVQGVGRFLVVHLFGSDGGEAVLTEWMRRLGLRPEDEELRPYCDLERVMSLATS